MASDAGSNAIEGTIEQRLSRKLWIDGTAMIRLMVFEASIRMKAPNSESSSTQI